MKIPIRIVPFLKYLPYKTMAIMQNMIYNSVFEFDSVLENKSDF